MTPRELAALLPQLSPEQLAQLPHSTLYAARAYVPPELQNKIAPFEHRAFAREATQENLLNAPAIAAGALAYPIYKTFVSPGRSEPSMNQLGQALLGVGEGMYGGAKQGLLGIKNRMASLLEE